jgi:hypothetical protein
MKEIKQVYYEGDTLQQVLFGHYLENQKVNEEKFQELFFNQEIVQGFNHLEYLEGLIETGSQLEIGKCSTGLDGVFIRI